MTRRLVLLLVLLGSTLEAQQTAGYRAKPETLPREIAAQPVAFSHRVHSAAGATCLDCHRNAKSRSRAGLPQADDCMLCHRAIAGEHPVVREVAAMAEQEKAIEWVRAYRVPDFVFFSHKEHLAAKIECVACHGAVAERDVTAQEVSTQMTVCMNCHQARGASNECSLCHELGQ